MKILLITNLAPKLAGNQSLTRTLNGLAEAGHSVHVLSIRAPVTHSPAYELHHDVHIIYRRMIPAWLRPVWVAIRETMHYVEKLFRRRHGQREASSKTEVQDYLAHASGLPTLRLLSVCSWFLFQLLGLVYGAALARKYRIGLFYGYEVSGAPVAFVLGKVFRRPVVTRFQGTYIYQAMSQSRWYLNPWYLQNALALRLPVDLVIMGDDGRKGAEALSRLGVRTDRMLNLTNGVRFAPDGAFSENGPLLSRLNLRSDDSVLLTVSHLYRWKRVDRAIHALPSVVAQVPNAKLVVVGGGDQQTELATLAKKLGVDEHVRFIGAVAHSEVDQFYQIADVFLSLYEVSNRGNPVFEAMGWGRAIVTVDDGSVSDLIIDGETGIALPHGSVEDALPEALVSLLRDPAKRARLGEAARKRAREKLMSVEERMRVEVEALEKLASGSGQSGECGHLLTG